MTSLLCGHLFRDKCVKEARWGDPILRSCPMCRRVINNTSIHSCTRKVFIRVPECVVSDSIVDNMQLRAKIAPLEGRLLQAECRVRQADVNDARRQHLEASAVSLEDSLNEERQSHQSLRLLFNRIRVEEKNARAAEIHTIQYNVNVTSQELRGKKAEFSLLLSERDQKDRELYAYLQALRESNSRPDAASQEYQALLRDVETQRIRIERLERELKAEKEIHNLRGNYLSQISCAVAIQHTMIHIMQILNDNSRPPTPTQCATPSPTPPRRAVVQVQSLPVKIEPLDLTPATIRPSTPIKADSAPQEVSAQSRQATATKNQLRERVYKPVARAPIASKHDVTNEQDMKPLSSRSPSPSIERRYPRCVQTPLSSTVATEISIQA